MTLADQLRVAVGLLLEELDHIEGGSVTHVLIEEEGMN